MWHVTVEPAVDEVQLVVHFAPRSDLGWTPPVPPPVTVAFYDQDRVVATGPEPLEGGRGEFGRDPGGDVAWFRWAGRVARRRA